MGRTHEEPILVEPTYADTLRVAVKRVGGQDAAALLLDVDQSTVSRTLKPGGRASYTTLKRMSEKLPGVVPPIVSVRNEDHFAWCKLGALLAERDPEQFAALLKQAKRDAAISGIGDEAWTAPVTAGPSDEEISSLKSLIANPLPRARRRADRGA